MTNKNARILVTGHGGMVGRNLVPLLREAGYASLILRTSAETDLRDRAAVDALMRSEKPEIVLHLASRVGGIKANMADPAGFLSDNLYIGTNVLLSAAEHGVRTLINLGSSCIYPRACPQPMKEEYLLTGPVEPTNEGYALAKIAMLKLCAYLHAQRGLNYFSLLPPNLYGLHERMDAEHSHVIAGLMLKFHTAKTEGRESVTLWGTGSARREFLFAEDAARAILWFLENVRAEEIEGNFLNIGSGSDVSIRELAEHVRAAVGYEGAIAWDTTQPDGMPRKLMDSTRSQRFAWRPQVPLDEGLRRMYAAFSAAHP